MNINLSKIKKGNKYIFNVCYNFGAGSGSQGWFDVIGTIKEINAEFIRVIPIENSIKGNKRSIKLDNKSIIGVKFC